MNKTQKAGRAPGETQRSNYSEKYFAPSSGITIQDAFDAATRHDGKPPKPDGRGYKSLCPAHPDKDPSLHFEEGRNGGIVLTCLSHGCAFRAVLDAWGLSPGNGHAHQPEAPIEALARRRGWKREAFAAISAEEDGACVKFPMRGADGSITGWRLRRGDGQPFQGGQKALSLKGGQNGVLCPWPLPDTDPVLVTEGEADLLAALSAGHAATAGTPGSTPGGKTINTLAALVAGRNVILVPDPDEAGAKWLVTIGGRLSRARCEVTVIPPTGADLDERLKAGEILACILSTARPWEAPKPPDWADAGARPEDIVRDIRPMRLAELFLDRLHGGRGDHLRLRRYAGAWWLWQLGAFREFSHEALGAALAQFLDPLRVEVETKGGETELFPLKNSTHARNEIANVLPAVGGLVEVDPPAWLDGRDEPDPRECICFRDKLYHLPSGETHRATPAYFGMTALPFLYSDTPAACPEWRAFLDQVFDGDHETVQCLRDWFGYCLAPDTRYQKMLFLHGTRRSGKGTIGRVLTELLGPRNVCAPTLASFGTNFGLQGLLGKSLAIVADARLSAKADQAVVAERLLSISGEDSLTIDRKYSEPVTVRLPTRIMILSNELPRFQDSSAALAGRFVILSMQRSFYGHEDIGLLGRLLAELPGILQWAIEGWHRLAERGRFIEPTRSRDLVEELNLLGNPVGAFLEGCTSEQPGAQVTLADLYSAWRDWCEANGREHPGNIQTFGRDLRTARPELKIVQMRIGAGRIRCAEGIALNEQQ